MARKYIHELSVWPGFTWSSNTLAPLLPGVRLRQGLLLGKMRGYPAAALPNDAWKYFPSQPESFDVREKEQIA